MNADGHPVAMIPFEEMTEGKSFSFETVITFQNIDRFSQATGDVSPLHMQEQFARERGFNGRVVHGAFLGGLVSRLVGVHFPGRECLVLSVRLKFPTPTYAGDVVRVEGIVDQVSEATRAIVLRVKIRNAKTSFLLAQGKVTISVDVKTVML